MGTTTGSAADRPGCAPRGTRRAHPGALRPLGVLGAVGLVAGCGGGALDPAGRDARRIAELSWVLIGLGTVVFVLVMVLLAVALRGARGGDEAPRGGDGAGHPGPWAGTRLIVVGGIALPSVVLTAIVAATVWVGADLVREPEDPLVIEVTGHQFWWDVRYPDHGVRTANEVHLPVGRPVVLQLTSEDVIHSFWVPRLAGKMDLVPGRVNQLSVEAEEPGRLDGVCAEFCGLQHANMRMEVVAHDPVDFERWLADQARPAPPARGARLAGEEAFLASPCAGCHTVAGTSAVGELGPDLTHLASRRHLAAGVLPNTREDLLAWLAEPQRIKPGSNMPATGLGRAELEAIVDYLEGLE